MTAARSSWSRATTWAGSAAADAGRDRRRRAGGPRPRGAPAARGHRHRHPRGPLARVCRAPRPRRRPGAGDRRPARRPGRRRAAAARGDGPPRHRAALRRGGAPHRAQRPDRRARDHALRPAGGRQGPDRPPGGDRRAAALRGRRCARRGHRDRSPAHPLSPRRRRARARLRGGRRVRRLPRRLPPGAARPPSDRLRARLPPRLARDPRRGRAVDRGAHLLPLRPRVRPAQHALAAAQPPVPAGRAGRADRGLARRAHLGRAAGALRHRRRLDAAAGPDHREGHHADAQLRGRADAARAPLSRRRRRAHRPAHGRQGDEPRGLRRPRAVAGARRLLRDGRRGRPGGLHRDLPAPSLARQALLAVDDLDAAPARGRPGRLRAAPAALAARVRLLVDRGGHVARRELRRMGTFGGVSEPVYILDAVRTPTGRHSGALAGVRPDDLAAHVVERVVARSPQLDAEAIDDVYFGNGNGAGEENRNVARMALLLAGLPTSIPGATVNRLCGSGMEAAIDASRAISVGDASLLIAGGVESMSRAPWVMLKPDRPFPRAHETLHSTTLGWRMTNPNMPEQWTVALGEGAEILADRFEISREEQDEFALKSHQRAAAAWDAGKFADEIVPPPDGTELERDEGIRPDSSLEKLG